MLPIRRTRQARMVLMRGGRNDLRQSRTAEGRGTRRRRRSGSTTGSPRRRSSTSARSTASGSARSRSIRRRATRRSSGATSSRRPRCSCPRRGTRDRKARASSRSALMAICWSAQDSPSDRFSSGLIRRRFFSGGGLNQTRESHTLKAAERPRLRKCTACVRSCEAYIELIVAGSRSSRDWRLP